MDNLICLKSATDQAYEKAVAADWNEDARAEFLWREYYRLKEKLDKGELYEAKF
tara:strand:+ start:780 stop:941 length:162 start_codon:yes stop_codon:yes gene_type:complete